MDEQGIDRRGFIAGGAGGLAALGGLGAATASAKPPQRPNVLWLVSEDNNPFIGAYGDPLARTPNLDGLAADGIRFEHSFSEAPVCAPSRFAIITGMYAESCGPAHHMRAQGRLPDGVTAGFPALLREAGYYTTNNVKTDYNAPIDMAATWDESSNRAHWRNRPAGAPFFAVFNYMTTHESSMFTLTPGPTDPDAVRIPEYLPDTPTQRTDRAHYLNQIERMDAQIGAALAELEAAGLAEDTIVFYYSDNGGVLPRSKRFCFDSGLRTALIARFPSRWRHLAPGRPGSVHEAPVSGVDLGPTVLSLAGIDVPRHMHGVPFAGRRRQVRELAFGQRSRMDESYDLVRTVRDERFRYVRNYLPHLPHGQHVTYMFNQASYREWEQRWLDGDLTEVQSRFWRGKPAEELYDLERDPDEVHNLAADPRHRDRLARMRRALDRHMLETNDNGLIPEGSPLEGYEQSRAPGAYPLRRAMRLAELAAERDEDNVDRLVAELDDDSEVIRYWAVTGLAMLGERAAPARRELEHVLERDESPQVRVAAAEALGRMYVTEGSIAFLADTLDTHANVRVRLQAIKALTNLGPLAKPALPAVERAAADPDEYVGNAGRYLQRVLTGTYVPGP
jgi:arylsulfatase A-like enzyme